MSSIALPVLEKNVRAALERVLRGESLLIVDGDKQLAQLTPPPAMTAPLASAGSLVDFFLNSPLRGSDLEIDRDTSAERSGSEF